MAESTRSKSNWDRLEEAIAKLASNQIHVTEKLDDLLHRVTTIENTSTPAASPSSSSVILAPPTHLTNPPKMKLDVPRFDGSNPSSWVFKITQFFEYHSLLLYGGSGLSLVSVDDAKPSTHHLDKLPTGNRDSCRAFLVRGPNQNPLQINAKRHS